MGSLPYTPTHELDELPGAHRAEVLAALTPEIVKGLRDQKAELRIFCSDGEFRFTLDKDEAPRRDGGAK